VKSRKVYFVKFACVLALFALAGCATVKRDDTAQLQERAEQRWNFLIAHQAEKAYDFLAPGFRATTTREGYAGAMNNRPVQWETAKFLDKTCQADSCTVHIQVSYKTMINLHGTRKVGSESPVEEHWIRESGHWYYLPNSPAARQKPANSTPDAVK